MILTCPDCATRYLLPKDDHIGPSGRTVRCAKCQTSWYVSSELDELILQDNQAAENNLAEQVKKAAEKDTKPVEIETPVTDAATLARNYAVMTPGAHVEMRDRADRRRRKFRLSVVGLIWGITLGGIVVTAGLAYFLRQQVIDRYPPASVIYKAFGIEVSAEGLSFESLVTRSVFIDGNPVLVVNGQVKNITTETVPLPMVALSLHDSSQNALAEWRVEFPKSELSKGQVADFVAQYPNPPLDATSLRYVFDDGSRISLMSGPATGDTLSSDVDATNSDLSGGSVSLSNLSEKSLSETGVEASPSEVILRGEVEPIPMIVDQ